MKSELNSNSSNQDYIVDNEAFIDEYENYKSYRAYMPYMPCVNCIYCIMNQQKLYRQEPATLLTIPEIQKLKGKRIRTTLPNILGTVTATVGIYNASDNRVELQNIISDRTGENYGNLRYLPDEIGGLQDISEGQGTQDGPPQGTQDCTITGGKGKFIDSGGGSVGVASIRYTIHECEIEITPRVAGIVTERYILNRRNNRINVTWPTSLVTRYVFTAWIQNKELWVEIEQQHRILTGNWRRTGGAKTKLGSWASLKI